MNYSNKPLKKIQNFHFPGKTTRASMEDDLVRAQSEESVHRHVQGMESVVATVSGYHGSERFKLIKLINNAGGSYVGSFSPSTTHLICWKFEGKKYELAKKLKTKIVNHRWLEDCIKHGRLLPEHSYTSHCGEKVGPLLLDIPVVASRPTTSISHPWSDTTEPVIDVTGEETENTGWVNSSVLKENLLPEQGRRKDSLSNSKRKLVKRSSMHDNSSRTSDSFEEPLSRSRRWETVELSSPSPPQRARLKERNDNSAETSRKVQRLVKKEIISDPLEPFYASDQDNNPICKSVSKRKLVNRSSMHENSSRTIDSFEESLSLRSRRWETVELSSPSPPQRTRLKVRNDNSAETSRKVHRLVKKEITIDPLEPFYASDQENDPICKSVSKRKLVNRSSVHENSSRTIDSFEESLSLHSRRWETEELSSLSPPPPMRLKKRNDNSAETSKKMHRLVKKDITSDPLEPFYASDEENDPICTQHQHHEIVAPSISSHGRRGKGILRFTLNSEERSYEHRETIDDLFEDAEAIVDLNNNNISFKYSHVKPLKNQRLTGDEELNEKEPITRLPASPDLSCVICWTDFSSTRGVLPCGHRFCFSCIQNWADHMGSRGKASTCPLCKARFDSITKMDDALTSDQKIYSQSIPHDSSNINVYILPQTERPIFRASTSMAPVCCQCCCREPEDLLIRCEVCQNRWVHRYCLDPPVDPWTCTHCRELRMIYQTR